MKQDLANIGVAKSDLEALIFKLMAEGRIIIGTPAFKVFDEALSKLQGMEVAIEDAINERV